MKGSKSQRQNKHQRKLKAKIKKFESRGKSTDKLKRELDFCTGKQARPEFKTGQAADPRLKKKYLT